MEAKTSKVFDYIGNELGIVIDYTKEDIVPYLNDLYNRFITYEINYYKVWIVASIIILAICTSFFIKIYRERKLCIKENKSSLFFTKQYGEWEVTFIGCMLITLVGTIMIIFTITLITDINYLLELHFIPEKYILRHIK